MDTLVSFAIAGWFLGAIGVFELFRYIGKKMEEEYPEVEQSNDVHFVMKTQQGFIGLCITCLIMWPIMLAVMLWGTIRITAEWAYLKVSNWILKRKAQRAQLRFFKLVGRLHAEAKDEKTRHALNKILNLVERVASRSAPVRGNDVEAEGEEYGRIRDSVSDQSGSQDRSN